MEMGLSATLVQHLCATRHEDLPREATLAARRSIFDTLGVILAGSGPDSAPARMIPVLAAWGGKPEASVIGHDLRLSAPQAAFANGAMGHQFDYDDTHDAALVHPTACALPAALAVAESLAQGRGSELVRAVALANDLTCRLGLSLRGAYTDYTFLRGPVIGIWGATAAACVLLGLDRVQTGWAFGHTLHQTGVTLECLGSGSDMRGLRDGFGARAGVTAAWMAKVGIRGDALAFEGRHGMLQAFFRGECDIPVITEGLGARFEGAEVSIKPWPASREGHATLRAALELRSRHGFAPQAVRSVHLQLSRTELMYCEPPERRRRPASRNEALQSLPFALAVALQHGSVPLRAYTSAALADPKILALVDRVTWTLDERRSGDWTREGVAVRITLDDGRCFEHTAQPGLGTPSDPLTDAAMKLKFRECADMSSLRVADSAIDHLHRVVDTLEQRPVAELSAALAHLAAH
ncbi:MAG: MmgE/PrpD family protein [Burkholderiaceae bacterium]|nr:MmgE/PrpD family protein [Burkholderiaceae bacterium]